MNRRMELATRFLVLSLVVCLFTQGACKKDRRPASPTGKSVTVPVFETAYPLSLWLWPADAKDLQPLREELQKLLPGEAIEEIMGVVEPILTLSSAETSDTIANMVGLPSLPTLENIDRSRPLAFHGVRPLGSWQDVAQTLAKGAIPKFVGVHSVLQLPAVNATALLDELKAAFAKGKLAKGSSGGEFRAEDTLVRLRTGDREVVVDLVFGHGLDNLPEDALQEKSREQAVIPGDGSDLLAAIHLRQERIEDAGMYAGMYKIAEAFVAYPEMGPAIVAEGTSEVLAISVITHPRARMATDMWAQLGKKAQLDVQFRLTELGREALGKGLANKTTLGRSDIDWDALAKTPHPLFAGKDGRAQLAELANLFHESGIASWFYIIGPNALGVLGMSTGLSGLMSNSVPSMGESLYLEDGHLGISLGADPARIKLQTKPASVEVSGAETCLRDARLQLRMTLKGLAMVDPVQRADNLRAGKLALRPNWECANKDKRLAGEVSVHKSVLAGLEKLQKEDDARRQQKSLEMPDGDAIDEFGDDLEDLEDLEHVEEGAIRGPKGGIMGILEE